MAKPSNVTEDALVGYENGDLDDRYMDTVEDITKKVGLRGFVSDVSLQAM